MDERGNLKSTLWHTGIANVVDRAPMLWIVVATPSIGFLPVPDDAEVTDCVLDSERRRQNAHMADVKLGELLT